MKLHYILESLVKCVTEPEVDGLYSDLLRQLLTAIFHLQGEHFEDVVNEAKLKGLLIRKTFFKIFAYSDVPYSC